MKRRFISPFYPYYSMAQNCSTDLLLIKPAISSPFTDQLPSCFPITEQVCTIIRVIVVHTGNIVNIYVYKVKNIYGTSIDKGNAQL